MKRACFDLWLKERGILHLKRDCFVSWLKERGILHLRRACLFYGLKNEEYYISRMEARLFALWLIERGILHLKRSKWLENRGLSNRGETTSYPAITGELKICLQVRYFDTLPTLSIYSDLFNNIPC